MKFEEKIYNTDNLSIKDIDEKQTFYMAYLKNTQKSKAFLEFIEHVNCDVL